MKAITFTAPSHWAVALINGDTSIFDYTEDASDYAEYEFCIEDLVRKYGNAHITDAVELEFCLDGDYGSLPGDYSEYSLLVEGDDDDDEENGDEDEDEGEEDDE